MTDHAGTAQATSFPGPNTSSVQRVTILALLCLALAVRLIGFSVESLWYDETFSAYLATQPVADLIAHTARDIHPPGYYLLLRAWLLVTSPTVGFGYEYLLAWPSLWTGMLIPALLYTIARQVAGQRAGLIALLLSIAHPTQLWYAQEVRMYAPAALATLLALWATMRVASSTGNVVRFLAVYALSALLALYTLYYAVFWLVALNVGLLWRWRYRLVRWEADAMWALRRWLLAQVVVAIAYLPWLPTLVRQATDPPVPTWRPDLHTVYRWLAALLEAITALWVGHAQPMFLAFLVFVFTVGLIVAIYRYAKLRQALTVVVPAAFIALPLLLILALSAAGPNLYHVRYTALSASALPLLPALLLAQPTRRRGFIVTTIVAVISVQLVAAFNLKTDFAYRADDHRSAVRTLAEQWRPGDAILVNAGWAYTALATYWPQTLREPLDARPAQLAGFIRLGETPAAIQNATPLVYRSGSIDGPPSLGWGRADADFFAITPADTEAAMNALARDYGRIWHYRIYDTVSDPHSHIRNWLATHTTQALAIPIPGPDYLLLERYDLPSHPMPVAGTTTLVEFPGAAVLRGWSIPDTMAAGETIYVALVWQGLTSPGSKVSLRLVDNQDRVAAQTDEQIPSPSADSLSPQWLALPVVAATPPTTHRLILIVYDETTLIPYQTADTGASAVEIGTPAIEPPIMPIPQRTRLARFDYLELESASLSTTTVNSDGALELQLTWRPRSSPYRDDYTMEFTLIPAEHRSSAQSRIPILLGDFTLGPPGYPSSVWRAELPVARAVTLRLSPDVAPGLYRLAVGLKRSSDQAVIPRADWSWPPRGTIVYLASIEVQP